MSRRAGMFFTRKPSPTQRKKERTRVFTSSQKAMTTATRVPRWSTRSKATASTLYDSKSTSACISARCPEEEMGRNSASPCTAPSKTATQIGIFYHLKLFFQSICTRYLSNN